jgi:hypothetical protein
MPTKVTKTCKNKGVTKTSDAEIRGTGILYEEENCQVFSERFLLLSTASGNTNFTLTRRQVVEPELPNLLTADEAEMIKGHHDEADGTLRSLDTIMGRRLAVEYQQEINLRDLLQDIQHHQNETNHHTWIVVGIVVPLLLITVYLTSKYWLQPLLSCSTRFLERRPRRQSLPPQQLRRRQKACTLSVIDEGNMSIETDQVITRNPAAEDPVPSTTTPLMQRHLAGMGDLSTKDGEGTASMIHSTGVRYSQPGRFQL